MVMCRDKFYQHTAPQNIWRSECIASEKENFQKLKTKESVIIMLFMRFNE